MIVELGAVAVAAVAYALYKHITVAQLKADYAKVVADVKTEFAKIEAAAKAEEAKVVADIKKILAKL